MKSPSLTMPTAIVDNAAKAAPTAQARERQGKFLIIVGTTIALLGVVLYCTTMVVGDLNNAPVRYPTEGLITIGVGLAIWLFGAFRYLRALLDLGPADDDRI